MPRKVTLRLSAARRVWSHDGSGFQFVDWSTVLDHLAPKGEDESERAYEARKATALSEERARVVTTIQKKFAIYHRCEPSDIAVEFAGEPIEEKYTPIETKITNFQKPSHDDASAATAQASMQEAERR